MSSGTPRTPSGAEKGAETGAKEELPGLDFSTFVLGIIGSAYVHLGDAPNPEGALEQDFELARQNIEILNILHDKTKGNLTGDEERLLDQALVDLKHRYTELTA